MKARRTTPEGLASGLGLGSFTSMDGASRPAISRRAFLMGAGAVGVVGVAAVGGALMAGSSQDSQEGSDASGDSSSVSYLNVPTESVLVLSSDSDDFTSAEDASAYLTTIASWDLDFGTILWSSNESNAACLLPKQTANPLTGLGVLSLQSGEVTTLLEKAVGNAEGFEIYDARCSEEGIVWTEANILAGAWRLMTAEFTSAGIGEPAQVDSGDSNWEMPALAAVGTRAIWQCSPKKGGEAESANSCLKCADFGSKNAAVLIESAGAMACPPYATADSVVCAPRLDTTGTYYQLTCVNAASGEITDTLTLPPSMAPLEIGYGPTGFAFSFASSYSYGDGIANMGTYVPMDGDAGSSYEGRTWLRYARTPSAPPAWCGPYLVMKAPVFVTGVDMDARVSFTPDTETGCDDWGEFLATTGAHELIVTFTSIDSVSTSGESKKACRVKVYAPASAGYESVEPADEEAADDFAGDDAATGEDASESTGFDSSDTEA